MSRRIAIFSLVVLVSAVALAGYFLHQSRKNLFTDPYKVIGKDACIVIETIDFRNLVNSVTTNRGLFSEIANIKELSTFSTKLKYLADQINKSGFKKILQEGTAIISFHPSEKGGMTPFLSKTLPSETGYRQLKEALQASGIREILEQKTEGKRILGLPYAMNGQNDTVFVMINSGLLICSTSASLIKKTVFQDLPGTDIRNAPGFSRILLSSGKNEDKIFVVFGNLENTASKIFARGGFSPADKIAKLAESAGGDIFIDESGVSISGYSESSDPSELLFRFKAVQPVEFKTYKILPSATAMFESMVLMPLEKTEIPGSVPVQVVSLAGKLKPFLGDEITRAYIDIRNNPVSQNSLIIYKLNNRVQCENIFLEHTGGKTETTYFRPDDQTRIPVYFMATAGLLSALLPGFAPGFNDLYCAFFDNFMITGNSLVTVSRLLYDNLLNKTLANDAQYRDFEKMVASRAGYLFYCVPAHCIDYFSEYFSRDIADGLRANKNSLNKIQSVGFQLAPINGMIYNSLSVNYKDMVREESTTEWETLLDTVAGIKPFFFTNHNTGAKEIFIQDARNNAYLINAAGRVLWKVPLKERIIGSVYMIDYYRNGKYQLLFSGRNNLHLIDRNGNYVERYPVRLRSPATNPLALFDYENNSTYRLVISGEDKLLYTYDKSGNVVKGWEPFRTAGNVTAEAGFYKVSGKDFIVVADESSVYFLDRSGKVRLRLNDVVTRAKGSALRLTTGSEPSLVFTSPDGTIQNVSFNGVVKKLSIRKFTSDHSFDFFDADGDGFSEYVFIDNGILYLYDHNGKEMFNKDFGSAKLGGPINFTFSSANRKIGVFDAVGNLIYLVDSNGKIMDGFPLRGASMFSIGKLSSSGEWNLIVGGTDRFLYNYKLEISQK
ncbi:MAG TPA: hypothetical protein DEO60_12110 [Bacteroidales bacterium]|nr:hypothetical protein [Bacteroidales bacterium]HBZ21865.1 hypothetical protein [Bacteroidales bacterium]